MSQVRVLAGCVGLLLLLAPGGAGAQKAQLGGARGALTPGLIRPGKIIQPDVDELGRPKTILNSQDEILKALSNKGYKPNLDLDQPPSLMLGVTPLEEIRRRRDWIQMPSSPSIGVGVLDAELPKAEERCRLNPGSCSEAKRLQVALASMKAGQGASPKCSAAATAYLSAYIKGDEPPKAVKVDYDMACLGSFEPRQRPEGFAVDAAPAIFIAKPGGAPGAMTAVGLLELNGQPICGVLLRNDKTFVTARHCFDGATAIDWRAGRLKVRPVDGRGGPWAIETTFRANGSGPAVKEDWAVVGLSTGDAIGAAATQFAADLPAGDATLIGYFSDHAASNYGPGKSTEDWRQGLRWPRAGLCQVYRQVGDCLQLICQTVRGFSGTPVFASTAEDQPLVVLGFISRPAASTTAACGAPQPFVTLAAAARAATLP